MKNNFLKFLFIVFCFINIFSFAKIAYAQEATSAADEINENEKDIKQLITNVASKVAELKLVERKNILGKVTDVSTTQITIEDFKGNIRFVDVDELTKFSSPTNKDSYGISDVSKGTTLGILGLYNKESRRTLSRFINVVSLPQFIHGAVSSIDDENYVIGVKADNKKKYNVDIETTTKTLSHTTEDGLAKSGFSKIKLNQNIIVVGYPLEKDLSRISATRIIIFPEISASPNVISAPSASDNESTVSTGSGKKLTPITK